MTLNTMSMTALGIEFDKDKHNVSEDVAIVLENQPRRLRAPYQRPNPALDCLWEYYLIHPLIEDSYSPICYEHIMERDPILMYEQTRRLPETKTSDPSR